MSTSVSSLILSLVRILSKKRLISKSARILILNGVDRTGKQADGIGLLFFRTVRVVYAWKNLGVWAGPPGGNAPSINTASQTLIFVGMEEGYIVAAVEVDGALRFYTARASQQTACEAELAQQGLQLLVWGRGQTEDDAMAQAMQQAALVITLRSMEE